MRTNQIQEIKTLDRIIEEGTLKKWDGINGGISGRRNVISLIEGEKRINPEITYFLINGGGKKGFTTSDINDIIRLNKLLEAKRRYDLMINLWTEDVEKGYLTIQELIKDGWNKEAYIIANKIKKKTKTMPLYALGNFMEFINNKSYNA